MQKTKLPEAYEARNIPFGHCDIDLSLRPFIPRPETEYWVHEAIKTLARKKLKILDAFAGSGCVGIALLKNLPNAHVDFLEKDPKLKKQIRLNLQKNSIKKSRAKIIVGNLDALPRKKYSYIFANPPYINLKKKYTVQKSVLNYEPHDALFAKDRGLYYIKRLIKLAPKVLVPEGKMFIEFGAGQKHALEKFVKKREARWKFSKDQYSRWRVLQISVQ